VEYGLYYPVLLKIRKKVTHFTKTSKENSQNKVVQSYANYDRKLQLCKKNNIHIMEAENNEDFVYKGISNISDNNE
jgi:TRAP-type uncharacterized transport system substrate-binding protein